MPRIPHREKKMPGKKSIAPLLLLLLVAPARGQEKGWEKEWNREKFRLKTRG